MDDYLLGHAPREWDRLREQHALWGPELLAFLDGLGLPADAALLEVGCGSGQLLADLVSRGARVEGLERDPAAAAGARAFAGVPVAEGDLREHTPDGPWDLVVARWVLSFLPEPYAVVEHLVGDLAPGGWLVVQDYDHDGLGVFPRRAPIDAVIEAYRELYRRSGGDLWVATKLVGAFRAAGLDEVQVHPSCRGGPPGSPAWRWVERFLHEHLGSVREAGLVDAALEADFRHAWAELVARDDAVLFSPLQVTVAGRATRARGSSSRPTS